MSQTIQLKIEGMTCDHCVRSVTNAVKDVPGVAEAKVSLETNSAVVEGDQFDVTKIIEAIEEEGYTASVN
jgi:copper chaperone